MVSTRFVSAAVLLSGATLVSAAVYQPLNGAELLATMMTCAGAGSQSSVTWQNWNGTCVKSGSSIEDWDVSRVDDFSV